MSIEPPPSVPVCPRCGYDQSGAAASWMGWCPVEGRCPECGTVYRCVELFGASPILPRWSFEHAAGPHRLITGLVATAVRGVNPPRYWRTMGRSRPVRVPRILAFLVVWWLLVRAVMAFPLAVIGGANGLMMTPAVGYGAYFVKLTPGWFADHYTRGFLGCLGPTFLGGWSRVMDAPVNLVYGLFPAYIGVTMAVVCAAYPAKPLRTHEIAPDLIRAWLMGLLVLAPVYEGTRIIMALPVAGLGYWSGFLLMVMLILAGCAWHQTWWVSASARLSQFSRTALILLSFAALAASIPLHILLIAVLEPWL